MRFYPRFLRKELIDEYVRELAPPLELFREFKDTARQLDDHNAAFAKVGYTSRFQLTDEGWARLARLSGESKSENIHLICQCTPDQRCHCDLLLLLARRHFDAAIKEPEFEYPEISASPLWRPRSPAAPPGSHAREAN